MKIFKIIGIILVVLILIIGLAAVVFIKTFDIKRFKPQIIEAMKGSLKREVDFTDIALQLSLSQGVRLDLKQFVIQDDPIFQSGELFKVGEVHIALNVLDFLFKRQISVSSISIDSPQITVIRLKDGQMNVTSLGSHPSPASFASQQSAQSNSSTIQTQSVSTSVQEFKQDGTASPTPHQNSIADLPALMVRSILIKNAVLNYIDQSFDPAMSLTVSDLDLNFDHFSLSDSFPLRMDGVILSQEKNFHIDGRIQILLSSNQVKLSQVKVSTDLGKLSLQKLRESVPMLKQTPLPESLAGEFQIIIKELLAGPHGLSSISMDIVMENGNVSFIGLSQNKNVEVANINTFSPLEKRPNIDYHKVFNEEKVNKDIAPGISFNASHIGVSMTDISLNNPFLFKIQAALFSDAPNIFMVGNAQLNLETQGFLLKNVKVSTELSSWDLAKIQPAVAALKGVDIPQQLSGQFNTTIDHMEFSSVGLGKLLADGKLTNGSLKVKQLSKPIESIQSSFRVTESEINVQDFSGQVGTGSFHSNLTLDDYLGKQNFNADMKLDSIDLSEVLEQKDLPATVEGIVQGDFQLQGQGFSIESLRKSLLGGGSLNVSQGRLTDMNVLKSVLTSISIVPIIPVENLMGAIESSLPPQYKDALTKKDTILKKVNFVTSFKDGKILLNPAEIEADDFLFSARGEMDLDQNYSLEGFFFIPTQISASMVESVNELQYLLDEQQRILIPLKISGKGAKISVLPDVQYIGKKMIVNKGKSELEKVLNKVFDKGAENTTSSQDPSGGESANPDDQNKRPEQQLLENILDKVFQ